MIKKEEIKSQFEEKLVMRTEKVGGGTVTYNITRGAPKSADKTAKRVNDLGRAGMNNAAICQQCINANVQSGGKSDFKGKPIGKESARNQNIAAKVPHPHSAG
jgi:hypothetical protein